MARATLADRLSTRHRTIILSSSRRHKLWGYLFALPSIVLFLAFSLYPILRTFYLSLYSYDMLTTPKFLGIANFQALAADTTFQASLIATFTYVLGTYIPVWILALLLAIGLNQRLPGRALFRTVYFIPVVMSMVVVSIIWNLLFQYNGLLNAYLGLIHIHPINWLTSQSAAPFAVIILSIWKEVGFYTVIFLAGLQNIPHEYYEAAHVDGASARFTLAHITLPLLRPTIIFATIMGFVNGIQVFIPQYVMTQGGPINATLVIALDIYKTAFVYLAMGRACAMAVVLFLIIGIITAIQFSAWRWVGSAS